MSLIALPAFLTRRRGETPMPETTTETTNTVVMRFRTRGGAVVEVSKTYRTGRYAYRCLGCDYDNDSSRVIYARDDANAHAAACWSMPKPGGEAG
ncbi:hypothetical protein [Streptomyces sp. CBMA152]|uniref:hypothetical protein n=1 Tax=Streptomyces sp. CBMA152 TaxID=1896312 RepID=UPI00166115B1|nr:hypothetical protein [Streptomyces sp. CBMA152]MBD0743555.1 hypothetical protein [Streptomyces sp. CBMA152]